MVQLANRGNRIYVSHINIRQSIFFLVLKLIFLDLLSVALLVGYFIAMSNFSMSGIFSNPFRLFDVSYISILLLIKIILAVYVIMEWINEYYEVWPTLLIHRRGFILKKEERHPLSHIRSVKLEQGIFGRFFGFGTITIYDWYLERYTSLYLIHNPVKYYNIIERIIPRTEKEKAYFQDVEELGSR